MTLKRDEQEEYIKSEEIADKTATGLGTTIVPAGLSLNRSPALLAIKGCISGQVFPIDDGTVIGRENEAHIRVEGARISRKHAQMHLRGSKVFIRDLGSTNGTFHNGEKVLDEAELKEGDKVRIGGDVVFRFSYMDADEEDLQKKLFESATRDSLTGAYNRKYLLERLESELAFAVRHGGYVSLVMFDIDKFKPINDTHGHQAGDRVLTSLANVVHTIAREEDIFGRYGGEEFCVIIRGVDPKGTWRFAERLRHAVEKMQVSFASIPISVTISIGISVSINGEPSDPQDIIKEADGYLYQAKHNGRNRIEGKR